jgi:hypothetical protein
MALGKSRVDEELETKGNDLYILVYELARRKGSCKALIDERLVKSK